MMYCGTTVSNTGRFNGSYALLEQRLESELLLFACRHHVYELVLERVSEAQIHQVLSQSSYLESQIFHFSKSLNKIGRILIRPN